MTSLNSWESLLHLLLPPNHCYCPLPQEMELDFCMVLPLCSLPSQAELMLSLLFCAVREAGLQLCRLRARLSGHLANSHCSGDTLVLQGCLCQSRQEGPGIAAGGTQTDAVGITSQSPFWKPILFFEMTGFPEAYFVQSSHFCLVQPLFPSTGTVGAAQSPPRQCELELEGLSAGAWRSIPVFLLLNIYSETYQMLPRKGFVSFQVPRCSCRRG